MWNEMFRMLMRLSQDKDFVPENRFWENVYVILTRTMTEINPNVELPERREKIDGFDLLKVLAIMPEQIDLTRSLDNMTIFDIAMMLSAVRISQVGTRVMIKYDLITADNVYHFIGKYLIGHNPNDEDIVFAGSARQYYNLFELYECVLREARGIVVDMKSGELITAPFRKFANMGEWAETKQEVIEDKIRNAKVVEYSDKMDGSLIIARCVGDEIVVTSSGQMNAEISDQLRWAMKYIQKSEYQRFLRENSDWTCMFELIDRHDTHVVPIGNKTCGLYLTGMRNIHDGSMKTYAEVRALANQYQILTTKVFDKTFDEILKMRQTASHDDMEGFVVNIDGYLVKIKCKDYLSFQKIKHNLTVNDLIPVLLDDKRDDLMAYLNKEDQIFWGEKLDNLIALRQKIFAYADEMWEKAPKTSRKETAIWINKNCHPMLKCFVFFKMDNTEFEPWIHLKHPRPYLDFMKFAKCFEAF